jgi:hypothetical protein
MTKFRVAVVAAMLTATTSAAGAQTADERAAARALVAKYADAAVMVRATLKTRVVLNGREQLRDVPLQVNGLVLTPDGVTIMPLSLLEPGDVLTRTLTANQPSAKVEVSSETTELRIRMPDGTELPASVALRDSDLDLVFLKPVTPLAAAVTAIDSAASGTVQVLDPLLVVQRGGERDDWRTYASLTYAQVIVDRPRSFISVPMTSMYGNGMGATVFDLQGHFIGLYVGIGGSPSQPAGAILPAAEIRGVAKQVK